MVAAVWLAISGGICVAEAPDAETSFTVRSWGVRDGLPAEEITGLARTPDGFLWIGISQGLIRFDGDRFVLLTTNTTPALGDNRVTSLLADEKGDLWVGTEGGTVARRHQNVLTRVALADSLRANAIGGLVEDPGRGVWVLSPAGIARLTATNCDMIPSTNASILKLASRGLDAVENRFWCLTPRYAFGYRDGEWQILDPFQRNGARLLSICPRRAGGAWVGVSSDGMFVRAGQVYQFKDGAMQIAMEPYPWPGDSLRTSVQAIWEDRHGRVWVGTSGSGVFFWTQSKGWQPLTTDGVLANAVVTQIIEDSEGFLWIATQGGGLHQVSERAVTTLLLPEQARQAVIQTVCASHDGSLLVGTDGGGVFNWRDGAFEPMNAGLGDPYVRALFEDSRSNLWAGTRTGLYRWAASQFVPANTVTPFNRTMNCIGEDGAGHVWFSGGAGLTLIQSDEDFQNFKRDAGAHYRIRAITHDQTGVFYCSAPRYGLMRRKGEGFETLGKEQWAGAEMICSLYADAAGALWITTEGAGLFRFKDGVFRQWTVQDGLPDDSPMGVVDDASGYLWISFSSGVFSCAKSQLVSYERGRNPPLVFWQLPVKSSQAVATGDGPWQPQPARLSDGRLCFPSRDRLVLFDPAQLSRSTLLSPPVVDELLVDGVSTGADAGGRVRVKSGARQFEFRFTAPYLAGDGDLHFRFRLEGFDTGWDDAGDRRVAYYKHLPPGDYAFHVMAGGADGLWRESSQGLRLEIVPRLWERRPLQIVSGLLLLMGVAGGGLMVERARTRRKLLAFQTQQALEQERRRLAQDLHDDIGASVAQLMMLGEMASRASASPETTRQNVVRMQEKVRDLGRAMDETIWAVNPRNDTLPNLISYLQSFAAEFFDGSPIRFRLDAPTDIQDLPLEVTVRHNLFLAIKEAMSNTAKHSGAKEVWLRVRWDGRRLEVLVEDDGRGFDPVVSGVEQDGLGNMPARMKQIGGTCVVQTHPGAGCCVRFSLPLKGQHSPASRKSPVSGMEDDSHHSQGEGI